jgi:uncharacterized protein
MTLEIIFSILLAFGILLTAIPTVPGIIYMLLVSIIYAVIDRFEHITWVHIIIFVGILAVAVFTDYLSGLIGAKYGGANKKSIMAGFVGLILGLILLPPLGLFLGLFAGVFAAEMMQMKDHMTALRAASYSLAGTIVGMFINVALAIGFFVMFLVAVF